jgi:hypothetical protein
LVFAQRYCFHSALHSCCKFLQCISSKFCHVQVGKYLLPTAKDKKRIFKRTYFKR